MLDIIDNQTKWYNIKSNELYIKRCHIGSYYHGFNGPILYNPNGTPLKRDKKGMFYDPENIPYKKPVADIKRKPKIKFRRFAFINRWNFKRRYNTSDWVIIGIQKWWAGPCDFCYKLCIFGFDFHIWFERIF